MIWFAAAASLLGAAVVPTAQPHTYRLENGLQAVWEVSGAYDAVAIEFLCPTPADPSLSGLRPILVATLSASAHRHGGPAEMVAAQGGAIQVTEDGGRIGLSAAGVAGSAPDLIAALTATVLQPPAGVLVGDGSLARRLDAMSGPMSLQALAVRELLGPLWWPSPSEIRTSSLALDPTSLDALREQWLCARRAGVAIVTADPGLTPDEALAPLAQLPPGQPIAAIPPRSTSRAGQGASREEQRGQSVVSLAVAGPEPFSAAAATWKVAAEYLGAGNRSPLFVALRSEAALSYSTGCRWLDLEGGILWAEAHCDPGDEALVRERMRQVIAREASHRIGPGDLARSRRWARVLWEKDLTAGAKRARLRAAAMASGAGLHWPETFGMAIESVRPQDIRLVLETLSSEGVWFVIESGPGEGRS